MMFFILLFVVASVWGGWVGRLSKGMCGSPKYGVVNSGAVFASVAGVCGGMAIAHAYPIGLGMGALVGLVVANLGYWLSSYVARKL